MDSDPKVLNGAEFNAVLRYYRKHYDHGELKLNFSKDIGLINFLIRFRAPLIDHLKLTIKSWSEKVELFLTRTVYECKNLHLFHVKD